MKAIQKGDKVVRSNLGLNLAAARVMINNTTGRMDAGDDVFTPPYPYALDDATEVEALVLAGAGVGCG